MNTTLNTTPTQVVAPVTQSPTISESKPNEGVAYNEGNGVVDTIVMTGPLSEIYTRALGVYFAKKPLSENIVAAESQALDEVRNSVISQSAELGLKEIATAVTLQTPAQVIGSADATVFTVDYTQIDRPEVIDAMDRLRTRANASGMDYVVAAVVEPLTESAPMWFGTNTTLPLEKNGVGAAPALPGNVFSRATESYAASLGHPIVIGLEGLATWLIERQAKKGNKAVLEYLNQAKV